MSEAEASSTGEPSWLPERAAEIVGKRIIVGITYKDHQGKLIEQKQFHGRILRANKHEGVVILVFGSEEEIRLPPDLRAIRNARPGEYRFRGTGEIVNNPDLETQWTIDEPDSNERG